MATGKTTIGKRLSYNEFTIFDSDKGIENHLQTSTK